MSANTHQAQDTSNPTGLSSPNPSETHPEASPAAARRVPDKERPSFIPQLFGARMFFHGEPMVYAWMDRLCPDYRGGCWDFYRVGDQGAGFLVPQMAGPVHIRVATNDYDGHMSPEAAGIVVTLFALNHLMGRAHHEGAVELLCDRFYELRDFAAEHPECPDIFRAID